MILEQVEYARSKGSVRLSRLLDRGLAQDALQEPLQPQERLTSKGWVRG